MKGLFWFMVSEVSVGAYGETKHHSDGSVRWRRLLFYGSQKEGMQGKSNS
jgi:hypothetical protein